MSDLYLRGVAVLDPTGSFDGPVDVLVQEGTIVAVGPERPPGPTVRPTSTARASS
jgi:predicted amidohydrolase